MTSPILVTGGTGLLGRLVVERLADAGHETRVLSRSAHSSYDHVEFVTGDISTGAGLSAALAGVGVVVHCAGSSHGDEIKTGHLVQAAKGATVRHIVYISVVGAERMPVVSAIDRSMFGYFASKRASEQLIEGSGIPYSILRTTQFQESMLAVMNALVKSPVMPAASGTRFQPIAVAEVADRLVELALGEPAGIVPEMGGPRAYLMADLTRDYLRATHRRRLVMSVRTPGGASRALRAGANVTLDHAVGLRTWDELLAAQ
jgi:uncharacterized protein YbjT (DUF2867 family)